MIYATLYLMDRALNNDGLLFTSERRGFSHSAYEHAIGVCALSELYTMTKESGRGIPRLDSVLELCVSNIIEAQDPLGGWSLDFDGGKGTEDLSVSAWMIQALQAAHDTGHRFSGVDEALDKAVKNYLPTIQDGQGAFKYSPDDAEGKRALTGAALLGMQTWGRTGTESYRKGIEYLIETYANPTPDDDFSAPFFSAAYYDSRVFFVHGGKEWQNYNSNYLMKLLDDQNEDGSWTNGDAIQNSEDATILNTVWNILMLEVYYRYLPSSR